MSSYPPSSAPQRRHPTSIGIPPPDTRTLGMPPTAVGAAFAKQLNDGHLETQFDEKGNYLEPDGAADAFLPYGEAHQKNGPTIFGFQRNKKQVSDPFEFAEKIPEDAPYEEMGETARLWKIFLQERGKVDADKVANWKDALDVLLVFAGLFSAVVSSFVLQTYQSLQVDNVEVIALLVVELVGLQRATISGLDADTVPPTDLTPLTDFSPARSAVWVNGLWFVSLVLSLTAALVAGLTKQWVNEYLDSAQVGTPRTLSRIRQFRAVQLEVWHVPVIIGVLPVLIHVALGVFLAGLIIFLFTLSTPLTIAISVVAAGTLATYLSTNILPLYNPSCPYKTPLTSYLYSAYHYLRHIDFPRYWWSLLFWKSMLSEAAPDSSKHVEESSMPSSLKEAEEKMVLAEAYNLEAQAAVWLYDTSANHTIHKVALEALSNIPLQSIPYILQKIQNLQSVIVNSLSSLEYQMPDHRSAFSRLTRSLVRIFPENRETPVPASLKDDKSAIPSLLNPCAPRLAAEFLAGQIVNPSVKHDTVIWAQIARNAFSCGTSWLDVGVEKSAVWEAVVSSFYQPHTCSVCDPDAGFEASVYEVLLAEHNSDFDDSIAYNGRTLALVNNPHLPGKPHEAMFFTKAVSDFMNASFADILEDLVCSAACIPKLTRAVPSDLRLRLALVRSPSIRKTSVAGNTLSMMARVMDYVGASVGVRGARIPSMLHRELFLATFSTLSGVVGHEYFDSDVICPRDKILIAGPLLRSLVRAAIPPETYRGWMNDTIASRLIDVISTDTVPFRVVPLLSDVLHTAIHYRCNVLMPKVYVELCKRDWLNMIPGGVSTVDIRNQPLYSHLVTLYIEGLSLLRDISPPTYCQAVSYLTSPVPLLTACQLLVISSTERVALRDLAPLVPVNAWKVCAQSLSSFLCSSDTRAAYERVKADAPHSFLSDSALSYDSFDELQRVFSSLFDIQPTPNVFVAEAPEISTPMRTTNSLLKYVLCAFQTVIGSSTATPNDTFHVPPESRV